MSTRVYGIKNCDTIKKALGWLDDNHIAYEFHDYKKAGIEKKQLAAWAKQVGWETLLNKRGTTYRKLPDSVKDNIDKASAIDAMLEQPSMIKRPVLAVGDQLLVGFDKAAYESALLQADSA